MKNASLWLGLSLAVLLAAPPLAAQDPDTGPVDVRVKLMPQGQGEPRRIVVGPRAAGVCRYADDCSNHFTMMWVGNHNEGEKIRIRFTTPGAAECFDTSDFTIDGIGAGHKKTVTLRTNPICYGKWFFFYDVSCEGGEGNNCGGVKTVDPGAMIDGGRRGG